MIALIVAGMFVTALLLARWAVTEHCACCDRRRYCTKGLCMDCAMTNVVNQRCIRCRMYIPTPGSMFCVPCKEERCSSA